MLDYAGEQLAKDSLLWQMKGMSEQDYRSRQNACLSQLLSACNADARG
jgi:hypothetical protein